MKRDISYVPELLKLRSLGWSFKRLGIKFKKDHTTVMYHCQRAGIPAPKVSNRRYTYIVDITEVFQLYDSGMSQGAVGRHLGVSNSLINYYVKNREKLEHRAYTPIKYEDKLAEKVNPGKMYREYLREQEARKHRSLQDILAAHHKTYA